MVKGGLEGVVAATTRLSQVDGERGELVIAGFPLGELAAHATFEETTWLLWHGDLPLPGELETFRAELAAARALPAATIDLLRACATSGLAPMDALRVAAGTISVASDDATAIVAKLPAIVATYARMRRGETVIEPRPDLGHAANFAYMLSGEVPEPERVRAPTFAISRVSGWLAHAFEQRATNRIIRPQSEYSGPRDRRWVPLAERQPAL